MFNKTNLKCLTSSKCLKHAKLLKFSKLGDNRFDLG